MGEGELLGAAQDCLKALVNDRLWVTNGNGDHPANLAPSGMDFVLHTPNGLFCIHRPRREIPTGRLPCSPLADVF